MPQRETELESEFEFENEDELEFEGEEEGEEFDLGGVISGLLGEGEGEFEDEWEGEDESEEFDLGGVISGLLGEGEYEDEAEEFFGGIARFVRKNAPMLKQIAKVAAPMVGTAFGGPLGGALGSMAARALGEGEFEDELEFEDEDEFEDEMELEDEGEYEDEASHAMTEAEALAEMMAAVASRAQSDAEAEAMIGAATVTVLSARDRAELRRVLPYIVRASCLLTRILRRQRASRPALRAVPSIVKRTARDLHRRSASGRPVSRRTAARVMSRQTRGVLGSPRQTTVALRRNVRATSALRRSGRPGTHRHARHYHGHRPQRRRTYTYR